MKAATSISRRALVGNLLAVAPGLTVAGERRAMGGSGAMYYSFKDRGEGGIAVAQVDPASGRILSQDVLAKSRSFSRPHKIRLSGTGNHLLATSPHAAWHNLLLVDLRDGSHRFLSVDRAPDDLAAWNDHFVIGAEEQMCYIVDASSGTVRHRWNGKHQLTPDGRRIEYVATSPDGIAWTSWQKDAAGWGRKGSRVVTIDIASGRTIADLHLPRSMPNLNLADGKERGPNPEIIIPSTRANTLFLSMDLYGGFAMADLDAAREGRWNNLTYHSAAPDQSWGTAFPDRAVAYPWGDREFVLVANAGEIGGVSWVDLAERRVVQTVSVPPGLSAPVVVDRGHTIVAPVLGKSKKRSFGELMETRTPLAELHVFAVSGGAAGPRLEARTVPLPVLAQLAAPVAPEANDLVLLTANLATGSELLVVRAGTGEVIDRQPAVGDISRVAYR